MPDRNLNRKISASVRDRIPFYLQQDGDYEQFINFVELYYKWLESNNNPNAVGGKLESFSDLDETLDIFVDEYQNVLASAFPQFSKIKTRTELDEELRSALNIGKSSFSNLEYVEYDNFLSGGVNASFSLSYYGPSYYVERDLDISVSELKVYSNPANPFADESTITRTSSGLVDIQDNLTFPTDYTLLTEGTHYVINDKTIQFIDSNTNALKPPTDGVVIVVAYVLRKQSGVTQSFINKEIKKNRYSNKKHFLKLMKEFYQSKGSESSYEFLFRSIFNEDIDLYYPKDNLFKLSDNTWVNESSVKTVPSNKTIKDPIRILGKTSGATATIERMTDYTVGSTPVREYFISNIFGDFSSREDVEILMDNGVTITETLYDCIVGFDIVNAGSNYPNNIYLNSYITDSGDGVGFSAKISDTTSGPVTKVDIIESGDNYVSGEIIDIESFSNGSGAVAHITAVSPFVSETQDVTFVQDETSPTFYYDLTGDPNVDYSDAYSRDLKVTVSNTDYKWDDTLLFVDFEDVHPNGSGFIDRKFHQTSFRANGQNINPTDGPKWGNRSAQFDNGYLIFPSFYEDHLAETNGVFTIDTWVYPGQINQSLGSGGTLFSVNDTQFGTNHIRLYQEGTGNNRSGNLVLDIAGQTSTIAKPANFDTQWNHLALYISDTETKLYINGKKEMDGAVYTSGAPSRQTVFNTWTRISHDSSGTYPANATEANAFSYDANTDTIECTANTSTYVGFVSLETEKFSEYDLRVTVTSPNIDDDTIGMVMAFAVDENGKEHTLSLLRAQGGTIGGGGYQIRYNHNQLDAVTIFDGNSLAPATGDNQWSGKQSRLRIVRDGDSFTTTVSQMINSGSPCTDADLDSSTTHTINLGNYTWGSLFSEGNGGARWGYSCRSQSNSTWKDITFNGLNGVDAYETLSSVGQKVVLGSSLNSSGAYFDYDKSHFSTFRVTSGRRYTEYADGSDTRIRTWDLDPQQRLFDAFHITRLASENSFYYYDIINDKIVIYGKVGEPDGGWNDSSSFADEVTAQLSIYALPVEPTVLPDNWSVNVKYTNLPHGPITKIDVYGGGDGYDRWPGTVVSPNTNQYQSIGSGAVLQAKGDSIGSISKISLTETVDSNSDGFGVAYTTAPTLDLSTLGDGTAQVNPILGPLCVRNGSFFNNKGFVSDDNRIHDGYLWQDYSYVVRVGRNIDQWREIVKKILHPAGLMMFGELTLMSKPAGKVLKSTYLQLLFEIIKNADVSVKNMDGLGIWTGNDSIPVNTSDLLSHGYTFVYDNYQTSGPMYGVGDDTPTGQTIDTGDGRFKFLDSSENALGGSVTWSDINYVLLNNKDKDGVDLTHFYINDSVQRNFTIYDMSDQEITHVEHRSTRPWGKFKILSAEIVDDSYVKFEVEPISNYLTWSGNTAPFDFVEFRFDKVYRGNVERVNNNWIGAIRDGADPRDEKFVVHVGSVRDEVPALSNQFRSLDRIKFNFTTEYPFDNLVRYKFTSREDAETSPVRLSLSGIQQIIENPKKSGEFGWVASTGSYSDLNTHGFADMIWGQILDAYDRGQHITLDSEINISPKLMFVTHEKSPDDRLNSGMNWGSVERMKFNQTPQSIDHELYLESIANIESKFSERTNIGHETITTTYNTAPTTFEELNALQQI